MIRLDLPGEPGSPDRDEWLGHDITKAMARKLAEDEANTFNALVHACESSTDPSVRAALGDWMMLRSLRALLTKGTNEDATRARTGRSGRTAPTGDE